MDSRKVCKALGLPVISTGNRARYDHRYGEIRLCSTMFQGIKCTLVVQLWNFSAPDVWLVFNHKVDNYNNWVYRLTLVLFRDHTRYGDDTDPRETFYRIANVSTVDEVVKRFDHEAALRQMLVAMFS